MSFSGLLVTEIFHSLQGESSLTGVPFVFVRLTGCNLRCTYCDSAHAFHGGTKMSHAEVISRVKSYGVKHVLVTGGEPLMQRNSIELMKILVAEGFVVSIETHGEASLQEVPKDVRVVMDIKTPSSAMNRGAWKENLKYLKSTDEIKFVIASKEDFVWAKDVLKTLHLPMEQILFSPVNHHPESPGDFPGVEPVWLAEKMLEDRVAARFQIQLHKTLWGNRTGV